MSTERTIVEYIRRDTGDPVGHKGSQRIQDILDVLEDEIRTKRYRKITPFNVMRTAGWSAAVFYQYFETIEDAVQELYYRRLRQVSSNEAPWTERDSHLRAIVAFIDVELEFTD